LIGYSIRNTLQADNVSRVVKHAGRKYDAPEIINSNQDSQFASNEYIELIKNYKTISIDGKGRATDNVAIERFFRSLKWERLYLMYSENIAEMKTLTKEYIENYNYHRSHQSYNYKTPGEAYFGNLANAA